MGLFLRKNSNEIGSPPLYTMGNQNTVLVVGLGNVGKKYDGTRHNVGFFCVDSFIKKQAEFDKWVEKKDLKCLVTSATLGNSRVIVIKPTTLMNNSGQAVQAVSHFYKFLPQNIVVVHDELDIPFGQIRMRKGGGAAGHNGIKSLIDHIGDGFNRVRVGIGNEHAGTSDSADFVLSKFSKDEKTQLDTAAREVNSILVEYIYSGELASETRSFIF